jgi:hypothetical protein
MDQELHYLFLFMFFVLSLLVFTNTYNIYRLTKKETQEKNLMDMQEFKDIHPLIKELYKEAVVNGVFYIQNMIVNDIIKMNNIDKWYNSNREDLLELIQVIKDKVNVQYLKDNKYLTISSSDLSKLHALDIKGLIKELKKS